MKQETKDAIVEQLMKDRNVGCLTGDEDFMVDCALDLALPVVVRRCLRHIDAHHDEFIDDHNGKEYFEIVDEILIKVKAALRELVEEKPDDHT